MGYMDYNSPIYREKYLKYKKKYLELKAIEEQEGGSLAGAITGSLFKFKKNDPVKDFNNEAIRTFKADRKTETKKLSDKLAGLESPQITQLRESIDKVLGGIDVKRRMMEPGLIVEAIKENNDETDISKIDSFLKEKIYKKKFIDEEKNLDNIQKFIDNELNKNLETLYDKLAKEVKTESVKTNNSEKNINSIIVFNKQIAVEKLCEQMGLVVSACDEKKKDSYQKVIKVLNKINDNK